MKKGKLIWNLPYTKPQKLAMGETHEIVADSLVPKIDPEPGLDRATTML
jgi:hypothetical protein